MRSIVSGGRDGPRLGIPVTYQFSVRYLVHTGMLRRLAEFTRPVVLMSWDDPAVSAMFEDQGAEVMRLPPAHYGSAYLRHRRLVEVMHQQLLRSPSDAIDRRRRDAIYTARTRLRRHARWTAHRLTASGPGARGRILAQERALLASDTSVSEATIQLDRARLDAIFSLTPYHRAEALSLRAAEQRGIPLLTSMISFDNPTTRGWLGASFDRYLVWNRYNRDELLRAHPFLEPDRIRITGAPQFDFYADNRWRWEEATWRQELALPHEGPVILFAAGPEVIVPHEPHLLRQIDDAIGTGEIPGRPVILFRRHPMDRPERWRSVLRSCRRVVVGDPWPLHENAPEHSVPSVHDVKRLVSTLAHAAVHVSTSSTMTVDGARFDRPQVGPAYDDRPGRPADRLVRELYEREHWLPISRSGGMVIARDRDELVKGITAGLLHRTERAEGRARLVREIITYTDGRATERVVAAVGEALGLMIPPATTVLAAQRRRTTDLPPDGGSGDER